jgi:hypothetical protein
MNTRLNALDLALDIAGSLTHLQNLSLSDEAAGLGVPLAGLSGSAAAVASVAGNFATITGLTGMTAGMVGNWITFSSSLNPASNNGTFLIDGYVDGGSVIVVNYNPAVVEIADMNWVARGPYTAENDINYARTDRAAIKGVNYFDPIPTYTRPTATGTPRPTNLANIAGKTTDARGFIVNRVFYRQDVAASNTLITLNDLTNLKHSDVTDKDGVPCFDAAPYVGNYAACYVELTDGYTDEELTVKAGIHMGEKIYGLTYAGASSTPDSVEVRFFSVPHGTDLTTGSTAYTWEATQTTSINTTYGFFQRLDEMPEDAFRTIYSNGISSDAALAQTVDNILETIGSTSSTTSLAALLTNTDGYYAFFNLGTATPTVSDALNVLNEQIGDRVFTGTTLTTGQTITASLQQLSNAIGSSKITRTIERLPGDVNAGDEYPLPVGLSYTVDGTGNGRGMWLFSRSLLRNPGPVSSGNDYDETSSTSVTFHTKQRAGDIINYFIIG